MTASAKTTSANGDNGTVAEQLTRRDALYQRLETGYQRIEQRLAEGRDVTTWEDLWIALLREYERLCDDIALDLAA